jgi:hypothetical protein
MDLVQGTYFIDLAVESGNARPYDYLKRARSFAVRSTLADEGVYRPPHRWEIVEQQPAAQGVVDEG